jgi:hypothetical protein
MHHDVRCPVQKLARVDFPARSLPDDAVGGIDDIEELLGISRAMSLVHACAED